MKRSSFQRLGAFRLSIPYVLVFTLFITPLQVKAADGDLDGTFFGGTVLTDFFGQDDAASSVAVQPDGKIVTAGFTFQPGSSTDFAVARYNTDGTLDPDFSGGRIATDFFGQFDFANDVAIQYDGKILVAGQCFESFVTDIDFALARYNSDGTPDLTFGIDGKVITDFFGADDRATAVAVLTNGKIIAAGSARNGSFLDFALAAYNSDGSLDTSFGTGGRVVTDFAGTEDTIEDIALQSDNKIVAVGSTFNTSTQSNFAVARYRSSGDLDPGFGFAGRIVTDFFREFDNATAVSIRHDGKIVVAGTAEIPVSIFPRITTSDFAVARYNGDGRLDRSFSSDGKQTTDFNGQQDGALAVAALSDNKIVVGGFANPPAGFFSDFGLVRYRDDGSLDSSFGTGGKVVTDFLGGADSISDIAVPKDGSIVAVGTAPDSSGFPNFGIARYEGSIPTPLGSIHYLIEDVYHLVGSGMLTNGDGNSLIFKLETAIKKLDKGFSAATHIQSFINQLQGLVNSGQITQQQAQPLIDDANSVIRRLR